MNEIFSHLESIMRLGYNPIQIFDDWLDLMLYALMRNEEKYLEIVKKYENNRYKTGERPIDYFSYAFGLLMKKMEESNDELLGELYIQWNIANKFNGQYFTPKPVARLMTMILEPETGSISDPCCGAGILLIEACKTMSYEQLNNAVFVGQDIDYTCVKMCTLNLLFFNLNGFVIHGNTLGMEYRKVFHTKRSYWGGSVRELSQPEIDEFKPKIKELKKQKVEKQISFF